MSLAEMLLPEFEYEMSTTRRVIERVPDDKLAWKANEKSNSIGWVVAHLCEIPGWVAGTMYQDAWDLNPPGGEPYKTPPINSVKEALALFDQTIIEAKRALAESSDEEFMKSWSLLSAGQPILTMPKLGVIRTWVISHTIHHRAILSCYLRLIGAPVPSIYGPSADEQGMA